MTLSKCLHLVALVFLIVSCTHQTRDAAPLYESTEGGKLSKGTGYFLEVVGKKDTIKIFPKKLNENTNSLETMDPSEFSISALYHFTSRPKVIPAGSFNFPTAKSNATIHLSQKDEFYYGEFRTDGMKEYRVILDVVYKGSREVFTVTFNTDGT